MRSRRDCLPLDAALICAGCGTRQVAGERFCERCGLPLVPDAGSGAVIGHDSERNRRVRKIKPQLSEGRLVRVAGARNQAEAEFIQALLLEVGVPSLLRRSAGFDVPDMLAAGPRDVLVPESGADVARELLHDAELAAPTPSGSLVSAPKLLAGLLAGLALGFLVVWLLLLAAGQ